MTDDLINISSLARKIKPEIEEALGKEELFRKALFERPESLSALLPYEEVIEEEVRETEPVAEEEPAVVAPVVEEEKPQAPPIQSTSRWAEVLFGTKDEEDN